MSQQNVDVVRAAYEAFHRGDVEGVLKHWDERVVFNMAENSPYHREPPYTGKKDITETSSHVWAARRRVS